MGKKNRRPPHLRLCLECARLTMDIRTADAGYKCMGCRKNIHIGELYAYKSLESKKWKEEQ